MSIQVSESIYDKFTKDGEYVLLDTPNVKGYGVFEFDGEDYLMITEPSLDGAKYPDEFPPIYAKAIRLGEMLEHEAGNSLYYSVYNVTWRTENMFNNIDDENWKNIEMKPPEAWGPPNIVWKVC
jgi:hypothetical protein